MDHGIKLWAGLDLLAAEPDPRDNGSRHQQGAVSLWRRAAVLAEGAIMQRPSTAE
jgi:hypothetical protein